MCKWSVRACEYMQASRRELQNPWLMTITKCWALTKTMSTVTWWNKFLYFMYQHKTILLKKWKHLKTIIVLTCVPPATGKHEQQEYQPFQRNPLYCHAEHTMLYELYKLVAHYHPSVSLFARTVLEVSTDYHSVISFVRYRVVLQRVITLFFPL